MTSYTLNVQPQTQYTIEYANQRGPQGPAGAAGAATTDASLLVSGTLSDARLSANVLLASSIGVSVQAWDADLDSIAALATTATGRALLTESVSQTGTGALVRAAGPTLTGTTSVANLTASGNGIFGSGTSFPIGIGQDAGRGGYLTGTVAGTTFGLGFASANAIFPCSGTASVTNTVSLGRADYQFLNFFSQNATFSGLLDLRKAAAANILQFSTNTFLRTDTSQLSIYDTGLGRSNIALWRGGNFVVGSGTLIAASSGVDATGNVVDTSLSRNAAGVWQMGTTAANALGSLLLTNLTASGTVQGVGVHSLTNGFAVGNPPLAASVACLRTPNDFRILDDGSLRIDNATTRMLRLRTNTTSVTTTSTLSSGVENMFELIHTVNQTGTAGSTNFLINRTETALGSGAHNFADFQVGGTTRFRVSNAGAIQVGSTGTLVTSILSATATLDFGSISSNGTETLTITVTGAVAGDSVFLGCPAGLDAGLVFCASVTAADTVTVRMHNSSGGSVDPASGTFRATVIRF
jgi:hypothetical protein